MQKKFLLLNNIGAYKIAFHLSNYVWNIVIEWDYFTKRTVGIQYASATDSMSANIAEGFGRYTKKDKIKFYRYCFGSMKESMDWTQKAKVRNLLTTAQYTHIMRELQKMPQETNYLIKFTNEKLTI
ncbi:MAG: four helix bundle protein [bacterium]|nr:four helix bundle protein [bacterium]